MNRRRRTERKKRQILPQRPGKREKESERGERQREKSRGRLRTKKRKKDKDYHKDQGKKGKESGERD